MKLKLNTKVVGITLAAAAAAGGLAVPLAGAAGAPPSTTSSDSSSTATPSGSSQQDRLAKAETRCTAAIDKRLDALARGKSKVDAATYVPEATRAELDGQLASAVTDLNQRRAVIAGHPSADVLRSTCKGVFTENRVFLLDGPKVAALSATNRLAKVDAHAAEAKARLAKAIASAPSRGVSDAAIADAKAKAADAQAKATDAHHQVDGLLDALLPITPAQVNDKSATATLQDAKSRLKAAAADGKAARADRLAIVKDLRKPA